MSSVVFSDRKIFIEGKPVQIVSGAMHYFRVPAELWEDRLLKLRQCGLNCVETYLCWNLHEPREGEFDFSGMLDFEKFVRIAGRLGLYVILRPGPFICAEWDNGGIPAWVMNKPGIEYRRMNKVWLDSFRGYYDRIMSKIRDLQYDNGGPVIAVQVENEYGSYGHDREYLAAVRQMSLDHGVTVPLFTADGAGRGCLIGGLLENSPAALTFGSGGTGAFALGKQFRPSDPPFCVEFWCGWFDSWGGGPHHTRPAKEVASETEDMLRAGGSINYYMFHGGTTFGFMAGANGFPGEAYTPDVSSYDYDSPLNEAGDPTEKYFAIQNVLRKYRPDAEFGTPVPSEKIAYGKIRFTGRASLLENLDVLSAKQSVLSPRSMESFGQNYGFIHYRTHLDGPVSGPLGLWDVRDRAWLFVDGEYFATYYRNDPSHWLPIPIRVPEKGAVLDILVENFGRINYGVSIGHDFKGICTGVSVGNQFRFGWDVWTLPMDNLDCLQFKPMEDVPEEVEPAFYRAEFDIEKVADTFVVFPGHCGVVWVNGHNLGRYWEIGPQKTLYLPAPFLKKGRNEIIVFETEQTNQRRNYVELTDTPQL